jgi:hypothetical protein
MPISQIVTNSIAPSQTITTPSIAGLLTMTTGGVTFNANPGGGTQATLNDYEIGSWVPKNSSGTALTASSAGYIKIGKLVMIYADISNWSQSAIYNLPFTPASIQNPGGVFVTYNDYTAGQIAAVPNSAQNSFDFYYNGNTPASPTNRRIVFAGVYQSAN